jgi:hypothetical protein
MQLIDLVCGWNAVLVKDEIARSNPDQITVLAVEDGADGPRKVIKRDGFLVSYYDLPRGLLTASVQIEQLASVASLRHLTRRERATLRSFYGANTVSDLPTHRQVHYTNLGHSLEDVVQIVAGENEILLFYDQDKIMKLIAYCYTG